MRVVRTAREFHSPWAALLLGLAFGLFSAVGSGAALAAPDPAKTQGPNACGECHKTSVEVWQETTHAKTFRAMPRSDKAREIADKLGIKRIKKESACLACHFTSMLVDGKEKPIAGIACESCHGAGQDWIKIHSDYGGKTVTRETEDPDHRAQRIAASEAAGMIRPARLYAWASNCFQCHTVPLERLVNDGGHPAGSKFELVAWSQGEVRHNLWFSGGKENVHASPERKRMMYVVGRALDLEYALRGVAKATIKAGYAVSMAKRAKAAALRLKKIAELVSIPEVDEILAVAGAAKLKLNNEAALSEAADKVASATKAFAETYDGSTLAALDSLIPPPDKYKGTPAR